MAEETLSDAFGQWLRLQVEVQLVAPALGSYEGVRVRATLCQLDEAEPQGFSEAIPAVEVPVQDQDHWTALDTTGKASHKDARLGGLALVRSWPAHFHSHGWAARASG